MNVIFGSRNSDQRNIIDFEAYACSDDIQTPDTTIIESIHRDILLKILFLTISVHKCILNLKQTNIYYGVLT